MENDCEGVEPTTTDLEAEVAYTLARYQQARYVAQARAEEYVALLGTDSPEVYVARERLDRAETRAWLRRRSWWVALAWARQGRLATDERTTVRSTDICI